MRSAALWTICLLCGVWLAYPSPLGVNWVCALFSCSMNAVYPMAAFRAGRSSHAFDKEMVVAMALVWMSLTGGVLLQPALVAAAIGLHGVWDGLKHVYGTGIPFHGWYCMACLGFDVSWAAVLFFTFG